MRALQRRFVADISTATFIFLTSSGSIRARPSKPAGPDPGVRMDRPLERLS